MTRKLRYLFVLLLVSMAGSVLAQSGAISGTVYDEHKEPIIGAVVQVLQAGVARGGAVTDIDGRYTIKPLNPGNNFEIRVRYTSYTEIHVTGVIVGSDRTTYQDFNMKVNATQLKAVDVVAYKVPLIKRGEPGTSQTITAEQIQKLPTRSTNDAASLAGGTYQKQNGGEVNIAGGRSGGTTYIVDGVQVNGSRGVNFPPGAIDQISVFTSGISAKYGDASGGVISITTKGSSQKTQGQVGFEHSVDGYNHNLGYFTVSGPLFKKKVDSVNKRNVLGYSISGNYTYDQDPGPNYFDNYSLKADKMREIQEHPLVVLPDPSGTKTVRLAGEYITMDDLETSKTRINAESQNAVVVGKIDYQLNDNSNLVLGGNFNYTKRRAYDRRYVLLNPDAIPIDNFYTGRGFIRFTQRFSKPDMDTEGEKKTPLISNAFYSVQADYQVDYQSRQDADHKNNAFNYNYIGKFDIISETLYATGIDEQTGRMGTVLQAYNAPVAVNYTRSELNPLLANYTSQMYDFAQDPAMYPRTINDILALGGLVNGFQPGMIYDRNIYYNSGYNYAGYQYNNNEQYSFKVDASLDLQPAKTKHNIQFGLEYQQRSQRSYNITAAAQTGGLWRLMEQLANKHILDLDKQNPIYVINGGRYTLEEYTNLGLNFGVNDTVIYNRKYDKTLQSTFDYNLRKKLGLNPEGTDYLNVYAYDPSVFSLDMFSADEIINTGNPLANWYGYDHTGKRINGQVNFNDWFTKKDALGNYTREVGAFRPNYLAGYIQDMFELPNNTIFNVGVRIERFDANTKVLKDPYSLYATHTVATSDAINPNGTPSNMGSGYIVYVKDNAVAAAPTVIGYRNGDDWYDANGIFIADPSILARNSGSDPQPYLVKNNADKSRALTMRDEGYDPNTSFTDYKPQVNVMPRISFSFPIADQSLFYAHYDVLVMRPKDVFEIYASPVDYYYINTKSASIISNPDLKPEKVFDYEIGFQQVLSRNSAITLNTFYKERKDMIQVRPYLNAWPNTYFTYGNRDFSTTKGLTLKYDLRRVNHLSMTLSYTLQFAEGTGSGSSSGNAGDAQNVSSSGLLGYLIGASLPNLRFATPLNLDSRHNLAANIDYRYDRGEGPLVGKTHILEDAGINLIFRARSGEPYTKYAVPEQRIVSGGIYGSRLPWHYMMDIRVDKSFDLSFGKKSAEGIGQPSRLSLNAFVYITNLLNTRDVLGVYGYTGRPDDNGYIASPQGQTDAAARTNPQSYMDLYNVSRINKDNLNYPRQINIGLSLNF